MAQVFKPFKIRNRYSACIQIHIRNYQDAFFYKYFVGFRCKGTIRCFSYDFCFYSRFAFSPSITFSSAAGIRISQSSSSASVDFSILVAPGKFNMDPVFFRCWKTSSSFKSGRICYCTFIFCQSNHFGTTFSEKFCGMISHIPKTLNNHPLFLQCLYACPACPSHPAYCKLPAHHNILPDPVASLLPRTPPCVTGLPVTQPRASISPGRILI